MVYIDQQSFETRKSLKNRLLINDSSIEKGVENRHERESSKKALTTKNASFKEPEKIVKCKKDHHMTSMMAC